MAILAVALAAFTGCSDDGDGDQDPVDTGTFDVSSDAEHDADPDAGETGDVAIDTPRDGAIDTATDTDPDAGAPPDPGAAGPHGVGYRVVEITYDRPDDGAPRTLRTALWYPTDDEPGTPPSYFGIFPRPGIAADATPSLDESLPVLVYSHGHYGYAEASGFLVEHFASHGWLVVAPDHTGNTLSNNGTPRDTAIYHLRAADISASLDWLEGLGSDDPIGAMASDRIIATGHSFGGFTTLTLLGATFDPARLDGCESDPDAGGEFCSTWSETQRDLLEAGGRDDRIIAGFTMAAGNFGELGADGVGAVETPVLQITGGMDTDVRNETNGDPIWEAFPAGSAIRVNLPRGCHQTFAIGCGLPGELETELGYRIVNTYALAFAEWQARGAEGYAAILDGTEEVSEEAEVFTN